MVPLPALVTLRAVRRLGGMVSNPLLNGTCLLTLRGSETTTPSELVAGFFTEAEATVFVCSFLAESSSIVLKSTVLAPLFLCGSASGEMVPPLGSSPSLPPPLL